jgi:hypothetical protein
MFRSLSESSNGAKRPTFTLPDGLFWFRLSRSRGVLLAAYLCFAAFLFTPRVVRSQNQTPQNFAKQSLSPDSQSSVWQSFPYDPAEWRDPDIQTAPIESECADSAGNPSQRTVALPQLQHQPCTKVSPSTSAHALGRTSLESDKPNSGPSPSASASNDPRTNNILKRPPQTSKDNHVEWGPLLWDSAKFLLVLNAWRLMTEPDTRAGLSGPFFQNYADAVSNIHGWNDGDPFNVNYIDHPMEGGVAGFLWVAHDSKYRQAEFGSSSTYWKGRLRAMAYSAVFSLQFEIGPVSEASIGGIQRESYKTGVVDWIITPTMGFVWMVGEDAVDQYVIKRLEVRTNSHLKRIILRSALNPTRSMSNLMQGKVPWNRITRPGVREMDDPSIAANPLN